MAAKLSELLTEIQDLTDKLEVIGFGDDNKSVSYKGKTRASVARAIRESFDDLRVMVNGRQSFATLALLNADLAHAENVIAEVWNDPVRENNGLYGKVGASGSGSWVKSAFDDYAELSADVKLLDKFAGSVPSAISNAISDVGILHSIDSQVSAIGTDENIVSGIVDDNGNAALLITVLGEVIIPILKLLKVSVGNAEILSGSHNYEMAAVDSNNNVAFGVDTDTGAVFMALARIFGSVTFSDDSTIDGGEYNYDFAVVDAFGNVGAGLHNGYWLSREGNELENLKLKDQSNISKSSEYKKAINTTHEINGYDYNQIAVYGQSLSTGHEGWPALSKTQDYGNLMLGDCVRPISTNNGSFSPFGGDVLMPLVANVQSGSRILTDAEVQNLTTGDGSLGEVVNQGMVNFAKRLHDRALPSLSATFVTTNNGVSGKTIEQLSKNNTQDSVNRYNRYLESVQKIKAIADGENKSFAVTGLVWMQGEWNYTNHGGAENLTAYKADLKALRDDMVADAKAVTGQADDPVFITYQTGASYTRDVDEFGVEGLHVGMAQWEFSRENRDCFLAGPIYPYTDKGGHLDANGYRWYGNYLGKIYHKVCTLGQSWSPLSPTNTSLVGRELYIDFHVPEPPLVFDLPYVRSNETDYTNKGFRITDGAGNVTIRSVEIIENTIVKIVLNRDVDADAKIWYASHSVYGGNGCLRDSDPIVALDKYEYLPSSGMYPEANIPELNNKPYPLHNWCIAFCLPVKWSI